MRTGREVRLQLLSFLTDIGFLIYFQNRSAHPLREQFVKFPQPFFVLGGRCLDFLRTNGVAEPQYRPLVSTPKMLVSDTRRNDGQSMKGGILPVPGLVRHAGGSLTEGAQVPLVHTNPFRKDDDRAIVPHNRKAFIERGVDFFQIFPPF